MQAWTDVLIFGLCIPKYWGRLSVLHFRGRVSQSELLCCLTAKYLFPGFVFPLHLKRSWFQPEHFSLSPQEGKHGLYNNDVLHRGAGLQYLQSWAEVQMMLLWWRFLWTSPGALCSGNCSASSADSLCHNKCGFITSAEYWGNSKSIHMKERRVKALRNRKGVIDLGSW